MLHTAVNEPYVTKNRPLQQNFPTSRLLTPSMRGFRLQESRGRQGAGRLDSVGRDDKVNAVRVEARPRREDDLHTSAPCQRTGVFVGVFFRVVFVEDGGGFFFKQGDTRRKLERPGVPKRRRLGVGFGVRVVAPAGEPALLVIECEHVECHGGRRSEQTGVWDCGCCCWGCCCCCHGMPSADEAIRDLISHHDGHVFGARQISQERAQTDELGGSSGHRRRAARSRFEFRAVVGRHGVDDDEADVVPTNGDGQLVAQDVILGFEVGHGDAQDRVERWLLGRRETGQTGMLSQEL